ncbi:carotenoid oxygenase family protein [Devosia sp. SL43]|uniref:carotenoid oxygenase family protein n=1 Tax=Devosia sp. SL43 TaxID=2806348 RepID=UPI001F422BEE|nr:carotenoid oxygenase family protein [Devosia sp. SL43]UJW84974.1 carotenoid oxygenase family protein [Devosia sp. SL43]
MADFSLTHPLSGFFAPTRFEAEVIDCIVVGEIPSSLNGAFYRMHGDWIYAPKFKDEASLSADGYISMFRFADGSVDYRGRYVRTDRYNTQIAARRQLYGYYRNPHTDDAEVRDIDNPGRRTAANTTPVILAGKLYATKEEGLPYEIDPNTLETVGETDFGGEWKSQTFTAHPKLDPATGETFAFGYEATGLASTDIYLYSFDEAGKITWEVRFQVPYSSMMHDMSLSKDYVIIPGGGTVTSKERLESGRPHWAWDSERPSYYAIIPRGGSAADIRWFEGPERSIVHTANAWNDDDVVTMDAPVAEGNTWPWFEDVHGAPFSMNSFTIRRLTFDLRGNGKQPREEILFKQEVTSFTRIDERFSTTPNRYIFVQYVDSDKPFDAHLPDDPRQRPVNSYGRFDLVDRTLQSYFVGPTHVLQEPTFVPRSPEAEEGDGYLLGTAHNLKEMRSELVIVDATTMQECARVILPFRNAYQVHGVWASPDNLPLK